MTKRTEDPESGAGRSPLGGIDLLLAAFAARGHVAKAWEELLAAADAFLVALEPVLERGADGKSEPAKAALGVVRRLRAQIVKMKGVSLFAAADLVLSLGRTLSGLWRADGTGAEAEAGTGAVADAGAGAVKARKRAGHAHRIRISE
ncbi:MAG: hypothetical protein HYY84_06895 [Deltaproteobacteria bacterium]|nr:hypothetical protein [Deltaproteobacteria bacterium]